MRGIAVGQGPAGLAYQCSVMSNSLLGTHFDIHGGGQDLSSRTTNESRSPKARTARSS